MDEATIILQYVGDGAFVNGVPARDLTQADVEQSNFSVEQLLAFTPRVYDRARAAKPVNASKRAAQGIDSGAAGNVNTEIKHD